MSLSLARQVFDKNVYKLEKSACEKLEILIKLSRLFVLVKLEFEFDFELVRLQKFSTNAKAQLLARLWVSYWAQTCSI